MNLFKQNSLVQCLFLALVSSSFFLASCGDGGTSTARDSAAPTTTAAPVPKPAVTSAPAPVVAKNLPKLVIVKAEYGDLPDGDKSDVTTKVREMVKADALSVEASNDNFGDPVEGVPKKLKIDYTFNGAKKVKEVDENDTLTISNTGE